MGFPTFYKWIEDHGFIPSFIHVNKKHRLLVDFKAFAYSYGYGISIECGTRKEEYTRAIAMKFVERFGHFAQVTFVNDGKILEDHPKYETSCKRKAQREKQQSDVDSYKRVKTCAPDANVEVKNENPQRWTGPEDVFGETTVVSQLVQKENAEQWDKKERAARGVSYEDCVQILEILKTYSNFKCVQCAYGEADPVLIFMSKKFDFVLSEDSDLLIGGVENLLRGFCTAKQRLYCTSGILKCLKIIKLQLQTIALVAGCDYKKTKIEGMGVKNAYLLIRKYGDCATMIQQSECQQKSKSKFKTPPNLMEHLKDALCLYNPDDKMMTKLLCLPKEKSTDEHYHQFEELEGQTQ